MLIALLLAVVAFVIVRTFTTELIAFLVALIVFVALYGGYL